MIGNCDLFPLIAYESTNKLKKKNESPTLFFTEILTKMIKAVFIDFKNVLLSTYNIMVGNKARTKIPFASC